MFTPSPRGSFSPGRLFRRLDRAAAQLNPILMVIVVGLLVLNLIGAALALVSQLPITRVQCASVVSPGAAPTEAEPIAMRNGRFY
jgi:hypothetical protein